MLKTLIATIPENTHYEIILINDASTDDTKNWLKRLNNWKSIYPIYRTNYKKNNLSPQDTLKQIEKIYPNAIYTTDVGQHQMWAAQLINCQPLKWVSSSGLGTMGFGLPSAIGAKIANPNLSINISLYFS